MTPDALTALIDATWPAAKVTAQNGWMIRQGAGGGNRVSAATATTAASLEEHPRAARAMQDLGQTPLFMVRAGEDALDTALDAAGYRIKDATTLYQAPVATLATGRPPPVTCFQVWPPLAVQSEIWAAGGIGSARLAIMHRATAPKTSVLGRMNDTPAGTAFASIHQGTAMLHAIETATAFRRQGMARHMIHALAHWAQDQGAQTVTLLVTRANTGANALYTSLGMTPVGGYHYRIAAKETP
ncbi:MAG: GNAT family N-acetyltransferase [Octadecabacter sp.]|nr:GNAT family N-acetyltransferase [Octadecabacter sp.]